MKKRFDRSGTARRKAVTAVAALTMALVLAVGGAGAATLLSAQPETLTVGAVVPHITAEAPQHAAPAPSFFRLVLLSVTTNISPCLPAICACILCHQLMHKNRGV